MKKVYISILAGIGLMFMACGDFLEEYSQDLVYASSVSDLSELLVGEGYAANDGVAGKDVDFYGIHLMDDDVTEQLEGPMANNKFTIGFYCYWGQPFETFGQPEEDNVWRGIYKKIGALNTIIAEVENFKGENGYDKVKGEAHYLRACWYFWLVNLYAKPYVKDVAAKESGVPIKLTNYIQDQYFSRSSIQEVYDQVVEDLEKAIESLKGIKQPSVYRVNEAGARVLLSRVYLYMNEWQLAWDVLQEGIEGYTLKNLNAETPEVSFMNADSPETIFTMGRNPLWGQIMMGNNYYPYYLGMQSGFSYTVSMDLRRSYKPGDLRAEFFFSFPPNYPKVTLVSKLKKDDTKVASDRFLIRYAEVYLNRAEALAMLGKDEEAIAVLQDFRKSRFEDGEVGTIDERGKELVELIREERRLEFCFEGHRWFDIRRYAVCTKYPESKPIIHSFSEWEGEFGMPGRLVPLGNYILPAYSENSDSYVLPIPDYAIRFNGGTLESNDRKDIEMTH